MAVSVTYSLESTLNETIANTYTTYDQLLPDVTGLSNGGYVVAYNNRDATDGFMGLNFYDADSNVIGTYKLPYSAPHSGIGEPSITQLSNGNVLVVWDENQAGEEGLKGQLFTDTGTAVGTELSLTNITPLFETPDVTALEGGGFAVSYNVGSTLSVRLYNNAGVQQGGSIQIETIGVGIQSDPVITGLADGGFAVTFLDISGGSIYTRAFDADGTARSAAQLLVGAAIWDTPPAIAALSNGKYAIAYSSTAFVNEGGTSGIVLVIVNADGTPGTQIQVNDPTTGAGKNEIEPAITVLDNGFIVVTWTYPASGTDSDIYGRIFDQSGNPITVSGITGDFAFTLGTTDDIASAVSVLLGGEFVTVWQDSDTSDGSGGRITRMESELVRTSVGDGAADTIVGDQLHDVIKGNGGADLLSGKAGNDTLRGGDGKDTLKGGSGNDTLKGDRGEDVLKGDKGDDQLFGNDGSDKLVGGAGKDVAKGGKGKDKLYGNDGDDKLFGNKGNDDLFGGTGNDKLSGNDGNDELFGGKGNDKLTGNAGMDRFVFKKNYDKDKVLDFQNNKDVIVLDDNLWNGNKTVSQILDQFGTQNGNDFVLNFGAGDVLTINNTTKSQIQNDIDII